MFHASQLTGFGGNQRLIEQTPAIRGSATSSSSAGSTVTINTPAANKGDILFVFIATNGSEADDLVLPAGWAVTATAGTRKGFWRPVGADQGATTEDFGTVANRWSAICWAISGADITTTPQRSGAQATSANPDCPSLTPSWAQATTLWLAVWFTLGVGSVTTSAYPSNYSAGQTSINGTASIRYMAGAARVLNAASEDPGSATMSTSALWGAETFAFRPNYL